MLYGWTLFFYFIMKLNNILSLKYPQVRKTIFFVSTHGFNVNLFHSLNSFGHFLSSSAIDHKIKFTNYIYYSQMHTNLLVFKNNSQFQSRGHKLNFMSWSTFLKLLEALIFWLSILLNIFEIFEYFSTSHSSTYNYKQY